MSRGTESVLQSMRRTGIWDTDHGNLTSSGRQRDEVLARSIGTSSSVKGSQKPRNMLRVVAVHVHDLQLLLSVFLLLLLLRHLSAMAAARCGRTIIWLYGWKLCHALFFLECHCSPDGCRCGAAFVNANHTGKWFANVVQVRLPCCGQGSARSALFSTTNRRWQSPKPARAAATCRAARSRLKSRVSRSVPYSSISPTETRNESHKKREGNTPHRVVRAERESRIAHFDQQIHLHMPSKGRLRHFAVFCGVLRCSGHLRGLAPASEALPAAQPPSASEALLPCGLGTS
eukprot:SAG31_NODE_5394_length_2565_cov_1.929035_1_plen_288_part_00